MPSGARYGGATIPAGNVPLMASRSRTSTPMILNSAAKMSMSSASSMSRSVSAIGTAGPPEVTECSVVEARVCRIVGVEIDGRLCVEDEGRGQRVVLEPVGRIVQRGEQPVGGAAGRAGIERTVERDRDRVDAEREAGRQGSGVVIGRVAGDGIVAVSKIDEMQNGRSGRIALIGDDLVAGGVEIEAGQRDDRSGGDRRRAPCR